MSLNSPQFTLPCDWVRNYILQPTQTAQGFQCFLARTEHLRRGQRGGGRSSISQLKLGLDFKPAVPQLRR